MPQYLRKLLGTSLILAGFLYFLPASAQNAVVAPPPPELPAETYVMPPPQLNLTLTLRDAIMLAMRFNPNVKNAELQRVVDKFSLAVARNQFAPQVAITAQGLAQNNAKASFSAFPGVSYLSPYGTKVSSGLTQIINEENPSALTTDADVSITQPLLRGFGRKVTEAGLNSALDSEKINQLNFKNNVITQVVAVINAYYQLVQGYNSLEVNKLSLRDAQNTLNQTQEKIKVGKAAPTERVQQQLNMANTELSISQNENAVQQSYQNLLSLLGLDPNAQINIDKKIDYTYANIPSLSESINLALTHNITYQSSLLAYKILERNLLVAKDQQKWQLDATARYLQPLTSSGVSSVSSRSLTLNLDIPIRDLSRKQQLVNARIGIDQARINLRQQRNTLITSVTNAYHTVQFNQRQVQLAANTVKLALQNLDIAKIKFNYGKTTSFELTSAQTAVTNAQIGYIGQQIQYMNAVENFFQTLGTTLEKWKIRLTY